jgi:uncharacterized integral membrane protein
MRKLMHFMGLMCFLLVVLAGFIFASQNTTKAPLWIGVELAPQTIAVWILLAFAWGAVLGLAIGYGLFRRIKSQYRIRQLEEQLKKQAKNHFPKLDKFKNDGM